MEGAAVVAEMQAERAEFLVEVVAFSEVVALSELVVEEADGGEVLVEAELQAVLAVQVAAQMAMQARGDLGLVVQDPMAPGQAGVDQPRGDKTVVNRPVEDAVAPILNSPCSI